MATYANLFIDQGSDFSTTVMVEDNRGDRLDLTNLNIYGQIRRAYTSETAYDFTITIVDPLDGEVEISVDSETTGSMTSGRYVYDIFADDSVSNETFKILEGIVELIPRVTRT